MCSTSNPRDCKYSFKLRAERRRVHINAHVHLMPTKVQNALNCSYARNPYIVICETYITWTQDKLTN